MGEFNQITFLCLKEPLDYFYNYFFKFNNTCQLADNINLK